MAQTTVEEDQQQQRKRGVSLVSLCCSEKTNLLENMATLSVSVLPFAFRAKVQPSCWKEKHSQDTEVLIIK